MKRRLVRVPLSLEEALAGAVPALPPLSGRSDGYLIASLPEASLQPLLRGDLRPFVRHRYRRGYVALEGGFEAYLGGFSAKSRSTLKRKVRKLAERSGGALDIRHYRTPEEMPEFHRHARAVSAKTYQERLLDAGLPEGEDFIDELRTRAARDEVRAWLLFLDGVPISYLYAPAEGTTLIYDSLGYDPEHASLSPGTVLQFEALRQLFEEGRFRLFDFTEGEGQHKSLFASGSVDCVDLLLLRRTPGNLAAGHFLNGFDAAVAGVKRAAIALRLERLVRSFIR